MNYRETLRKKIASDGGFDCPERNGGLCHFQFIRMSQALIGSSRGKALYSCKYCRDTVPRPAHR